MGAVRDFGFYVQVADMIVPKRFELYGATSYIFSDYGRPKEFIVGSNYFPWNTRNIRLNTQLINVDHSPVSSTFRVLCWEAHWTDIYRWLDRLLLSP